MKYQPSFDQVVCHDLGFTMVDGALLDMIVSAAVWAKSIEVDGERYYLLAQTKIMEELPCAFGSRQAVIRSVKRIEPVLDIRMRGRSNYYRVKSVISSNWGRKEKGKQYHDFVNEQVRKRNTSGNGPIAIRPETDLLTSDIGPIAGVKRPETDTIQQPLSNNYYPTTRGARAHKAKQRRFLKPTIEDIKVYCGHRKNAVNAIKFFNHYESNGWKVGRNAMKDWQAAVRTWEQTDETYQRDRKASGERYALDHTDTDW